MSVSNTITLQCDADNGACLQSVSFDDTSIEKARDLAKSDADWLFVDGLDICDRADLHETRYPGEVLDADEDAFDEDK